MVRGLSPLRSVALLALIALPCWSARARAKPKVEIKLALEWSDAWNRHHAFGADGLRASSRVTLELFAGGKGRAEDKGSLRRTQLDRGGRFEEKRTSWHLVWKARWKRAGKRLTINLRRAPRSSCMRSRLRRGSRPTKLRCRPAPSALLLSCRTMSVRVKPSALAPRKAAKREQVWLCGAPQSPGGTPTAWVFGKKRCLRVGSSRPGRGPRRYIHCAKAKK